MGRAFGNCPSFDVAVRTTSATALVAAADCNGDAARCSRVWTGDRI
jgi:hypothetical protein